jgi:aldehyde:ferredoxin oxidoreductase
MQGMGVTYATSPMGADHTAGNLIDAYLGGELDPLATEGQVEASRNAQIALAALDSTGLCLMAGPALSVPEGVEAFTRLISAKIGKPFSMDDFGALGVRVLTAELDFNRRAGFTSGDDRLPTFFRKEPLSPHNRVFEIEDADLDKALRFDGG